MIVVAGFVNRICLFDFQCFVVIELLIVGISMATGPLDHQTQ